VAAAAGAAAGAATATTTTSEMFTLWTKRARYIKLSYYAPAVKVDLTGWVQYSFI